MLDNLFTAPFWQNVYLGNSLKNYAIALGAFFVFLLAFKIFQSIVLKKLKKLAERTKSDIDDELIKIVKTLRPPFYSFLAFYLAINFLSFPGLIQKIINVVLIIWVVYQVIAASQVLISYIIRKRFAEEDKQSRSAANVLGLITKGILWVVALLMILANLGINITSLVAGLGIGGIAIAMALQNILGDLFGSFAIYFDKPFQAGDFIIVGDTMGTVEKIGVKTTRLRALQGEEIVMSNKDLTAAKIQNFKKMKRRRISFAFGVTYGTPSEKMRKIPGVIRAILNSMEMAIPDRVHFKEFGDFSLNYEVVYYIDSPDYNKYMDIQQDINIKIKEAFEKEGIEMAFPTQTVYLVK